MQDVENNMDDLFRRAVNSYGLKPGESKWDKISSELPDSVNSSALLKKLKLQKYLLIMVLIILLGSMGIITISILNRYSSVQNDQNAAQHNNKPSAPGAGKLNEQRITDHQTEKTTTQLIVGKKSGRNDSDANIMQITYKRNDKVAEHKFYPGETSKLVSINNEILNYSLSKLQDQVTQNLVNEETPPGILMTYENDHSKATLSNINTSASKPKTHHAYVGVLAGPVFSEVKNQDLGKMGFDVGVIVGYPKDSRFSAETGFFFTKKYYLSDGKYFSSKNMPNSMQVLSVEGTTKMFEIPLKVNYNVWQKNKSSLNTSAGASSYILTNENNHYEAMVNGTAQNMDGEYKSSSFYFAASVNISVGYNYEINKNSSLKVEPYLQIPLKGIGIGVMPVTSTGLHVGFIRSLQ